MTRPDSMPRASARLAGALCLLLAGAVAAPTDAQAESSLAPREGWRVIETDFPYPELGDRLDAAIKSERMGRVTYASASDGARMQGFTIPGNRVVGVYRNDFARRMLEASVAAGIEAPIRFYVTEDPDGGATLAWKTPSHVFSPYFEEGGEDLRALAEELDQIFESIAASAVTP